MRKDFESDKPMEGWEKAFDEKFMGEMEYLIDLDMSAPEKIKQFIKETLSAQIERLLKNEDGALTDGKKFWTEDNIRSFLPNVQK